MHTHCENCDTLREELRQLRDAFAKDDVEVPKKYKFTPTERLVFSALHKRLGRTCTRSQLQALISVTDGRWSSRETDSTVLLRVFICRMRSKLRVDGKYKISNTHGVGYALEINQ